MTYQLLRDISTAKLPLQVEDRDHVDQLRAYHAAGLIQAEFSNVPPTRDGLRHGSAQVLAITHLGQKELSRQKPHSSSAGKRR